MHFLTCCLPAGAGAGARASQPASHIWDPLFGAEIIVFARVYRGFCIFGVPQPASQTAGIIVFARFYKGFRVFGVRQPARQRAEIIVFTRIYKVWCFFGVPQPASQPASPICQI